MAAGDHIYVKRKGYFHHGVEVANGYVIHFKGSPGSKLGATIVRGRLDDFGRYKVRVYAERLSVEEALARAESKLGQSGYNLFLNNCEHFATWCVLGEALSGQIYTAAGLGGVSVATGSAALGTGSAVGVAGSVAGVSGAGIMSGLATAGSLVGGGAVAGLGVLGAGPAALSVAAVNVALKDHPGLSDEERVARRAGRRASAAGAAAGGGAAIAAVGTCGAVAGFSAAGITSGLAAIGGVVGGGMLVGTAAVVAAPAVVAAGAGFGIHRFVRHLKSRPSDSNRLPASSTLAELPSGDVEASDDEAA